MLRLIRTPGKIAMLAVAMLFALPGCATMIATSGISGSYEIPTGLSRKEVQERFGSLASTSTTSSGREIEVYHIRRKLPENWKAEEEVLGYFSQVAFFMPILFAATVIRSEMNKLEVAFVYGPDDRVLYSYETKAEPSARYGHALRTLTHPLSSETELAKCPSARECMDQYVEERQRRATEVGYSLTNEDEKVFRKDLEVAGNLDERKITKEEAVRLYCATAKYGEQRKISPDLYDAMNKLTDRRLNEITERGGSMGDAVAGYIQEFRKLVAGFAHGLTCADEETFQMAVEIAKDADDGRITREEALSKLRGVTTRYLINLYFGRS